MSLTDKLTTKDCQDLADELSDTVSITDFINSKRFTELDFINLTTDMMLILSKEKNKIRKRRAKKYIKYYLTLNETDYTVKGLLDYITDRNNHKELSSKIINKDEINVAQEAIKDVIEFLEIYNKKKPISNVLNDL